MKVIIRDESTKQRAIQVINNIDTTEPQEMKLAAYKRNRSMSQNALYWKFVTVIANDLGNMKDLMHETLKSKYLVPIYERDNEEYAEMFETVRELYRTNPKKAMHLRNQIVKLTSTTTANIVQFTEYLEDVEHYAADMGIMLPHPEDYRFTMGRIDNV